MIAINQETLFQFQTGSIKSFLKLLYIPVAHTRFNSKLVRLKAQRLEVRLAVEVRFNSKLVRLKG